MEIEIIINEDGTVTIEGLDFHGPACETELQKYLSAIGTEKQSEQKPEFFQKKQKIEQRNKLGV